MTHTSNPTAQNEKNPTPQTDFAESLSLLCKTAIVSLGSLFVSCCLKKRRHSSGLPGYSPSEATPRGENARDPGGQHLLFKQFGTALTDKRNFALHLLHRLRPARLMPATPSALWAAPPEDRRALSLTLVRGSFSHDGRRSLSVQAAVELVAFQRIRAD